MPRVAAVTAAVLYSSWVMAPLVRPRRDTLHGFVSELGAANQPHHALFGGLDLAAAVLVLLAAAVLLKESGARAGAGALAVFGVGLLVGAIAPMDCAPSLARSCAVAERAGRVSWRENVHTAGSVLEFTGLIASMALLSWRFRNRAAYRTWLLAAPIVALLGLWVGWRALDHHLVGWTERALCAFGGAWLATVGIAGVDSRRAQRESRLQRGSDLQSADHAVGSSSAVVSPVPAEVGTR